MSSITRQSPNVTADWSAAPSPAATPSAVGRWRWASNLTAAAAVLAAMSSLVGLLVVRAYSDCASTAQMLRGYDLVNLLLVVPALLVSLLGAHRGSDRAVLVLVGMLASLVHSYAYHLFGTSFVDVFLLHAAVFAGSLSALVLAASCLEAPGIAGRFSPRTPARLVAAVLALLAVALGGMWVYASARYSATGQLPAGSALVESDVGVHLGVAPDLALLVPAYAAAAVLLWRRLGSGDVLATALLIAGTVHQVGYLVAMAFQWTAGVPGAVAFDPAEPVIVVLYLAASVAMLAAAGRTRSPAVADDAP